MKAPSPSTRRQLYLLGGLAVVLILAVVKWGNRGASDVPAGSSASASAKTGSPAAAAEEDRPAAPRPRARASREKKATAPEDVPFLTKEMLNPPRPKAGDAGRNIFDPRQPSPTPAPTPTPLPPPPPAPGSAMFVGPLPPPGPTPTPVPPEVSFKFIGTFGPKDAPIAVLLQGDQLLNARAGDVVYSRFILRNIGYESVEVGYVGYPPSVTKRVGITP